MMVISNLLMLIVITYFYFFIFYLFWVGIRNHSEWTRLTLVPFYVDIVAHENLDWSVRHVVEPICALFCAMLI